MGVDCKITLPPYVQIKDVAKVLGVLFGLKPERRNFGSSIGDGWSAQVPGVKFEETGDPSYCKILIESPMFSYPRFTLYFFELDNKGNRGLNPGAQTIWQVAAKRLVLIFGGSVDYNDCDDIKVDFTMPPNPKLIERGDPSFYEMQEIIMALDPITQEEMDAFDAERNREYEERKAAGAL